MTIERSITGEPTEDIQGDRFFHSMLIDDGHMWG